MKYCDYKNWFLCIICLYVIAKTYTEIEKTYSCATKTGSDGYFRECTLLEGSGLGSDEGGVI